MKPRTPRQRPGHGAVLSGAAAAILALATSACVGPWRQSACGPVEHPPSQAGSHLIGDAEAPVPYSSTPGTSGWHSGTTPTTGVSGPDAPLREPQIVALLEAGRVVVAYDPRAITGRSRDRLEALARDRFPGIVAVTPFARDMGAPLVLNAWSTRQPCQAVDVRAIEMFVEANAGRQAAST